MNEITPDPGFHPAIAHKFFSGRCFNGAWELIDKADRTPEDEEAMLRMAMTSHWHWTCRSDYSPDKASISNWLISRVFALIGQPVNARRYGLRSLQALEEMKADPFLVGYAHEALARAARVAGDVALTADHLDKAREAAKEIAEAENRKLLEADLDALEAGK